MAISTGPALRLGAGIQGFEAIDAAAEKGLVVVGGYCPTVGLVGGCIQGLGIPRSERNSEWRPTRR